jgi:hypothetical protein
MPAASGALYLPEETGTECNIGFRKRMNERRNVHGRVLTVSVESHDSLGAGRQRMVDSGLQSSTLAKIEDMTEHRRSGALRLLKRVIVRSIIYDDYPPSEPDQSSHDLMDCSPFVISRDHNPGREPIWSGTRPAVRQHGAYVTSRPCPDLVFG